MTTYYNSEKSVAGQVITWILVALAGIAVLKLAFWVFGAALGLGGFLLFTVGPIILVGWVIMKVVRYFGNETR